MDWFLYDRNLHHEGVNIIPKNFSVILKLLLIFKVSQANSGFLTFSNFGFLTFSVGTEIEHWAKMG